MDLGRLCPIVLRIATVCDPGWPPRRLQAVRCTGDSLAQARFCSCYGAETPLETPVSHTQSLRLADKKPRLSAPVEASGPLGPGCFLFRIAEAQPEKDDCR